mmetsp:Transcript_32275/g.68753  ORF Transcript_32275/g.68753 Transcript_32275/m.68753 type:complete len:157 (+) Transcript_32275:995-1465(+)
MSSGGLVFCLLFRLLLMLKRLEKDRRDLAVSPSPSSFLIFLGVMDRRKDFALLALGDASDFFLLRSFMVPDVVWRFARPKRQEDAAVYPVMGFSGYWKSWGRGAEGRWAAARSSASERDERRCIVDDDEGWLQRLLEELKKAEEAGYREIFGKRER